MLGSVDLLFTGEIKVMSTASFRETGEKWSIVHCSIKQHRCVGYTLISSISGDMLSTNETHERENIDDWYIYIYIYSVVEHSLCGVDWVTASNIANPLPSW